MVEYLFCDTPISATWLSLPTVLFLVTPCGSQNVTFSHPPVFEQSSTSIGAPPEILCLYSAPEPLCPEGGFKFKLTNAVHNPNTHRNLTAILESCI